jgi:SAM-dependent methyltransferase
VVSQQAIFEGYAADAARLVPQFEALETEVVLRPVMDLLPHKPGSVLDVGAGTGRDAAWFAERGHRVIAIEPVDALRSAGQVLHDVPNIEWLNDSLPNLTRIKSRRETYDLIIAVGVWQHLSAAQHDTAISAMASLAAPSGRLIISVRRGPGASNRTCFPANTDRLIAGAASAGLKLISQRRASSVQQANRRAGVMWDWLCFGPSG